MQFSHTPKSQQINTTSASYKWNMVLPISDKKHRDNKRLYTHEIISVTHLDFEPKLMVSQMEVCPQNNILVK